MLHILNSQNTILNKFVAEMDNERILVTINSEGFDAFPP